MELTPDENRLLVDGLAALGAAGGFAGAGPAGRAGGVRGAASAARRLRADIYETTVELPQSLPAAAGLAARTLAELGSPVGELQAVIGAGLLNMNPAVVTVTLARSGGSVVATVRGAAKEGLIRQRAGEKAARRVAARLAGGHRRTP
ncbi:hypothetical protein [Catenuloplanes indicus]|uniref:Uncharacterized protein n=1 Tax=Catenuloplanes indicus TaxID=137267 RepID=A0AAE4AVA6_9ACTN|nr:hypothetical protein [Catenuloplanes indicus]MDQ0363526.1 hypothetical protein [Catenuloplanes indicus]